MSTKDLLLLIVIITFIGALMFSAGQEHEKEKPLFTVVEATRLDGCTYQVGLNDREGNYFSLTADLVKFSALGVDVNEILNLGEL